MKQDTNSPTQDIREALSKLFDAGTNLKSRAGQTIEAEFQYKKYSIDECINTLSKQLKEN